MCRPEGNGVRRVSSISSTFTETQAQQLGHKALFSVQTFETVVDDPRGCRFFGPFPNNWGLRPQGGRESSD